MSCCSFSSNCQPTTKTNRAFFGLAVLGLILSTGCFQSTTKSTVELTVVKDRSLALLENGVESASMLADAANGFRKLSKDLPKDPIGMQNLCIALLLQRRKTSQLEDPQSYEKICQEFEQSIIALRKLEPGAPDADLLEAEYYRNRLEPERAIESLRRAVRSASANTDAFYQLAALLLEEKKDEAKEEIRSILKKEIAKSPSNLCLSVDYLKALALNQDKALIQEVDRLKKLLAPIIGRMNSKIPGLLENIVAEAEKENWQKANRNVISLGNAINPEVAYRNDKRLVEPHPLEYVQLEFTTPAHPVVKRPSSSLKQSFPVSKSFDSNQGTITSIATEDFDLDSQFDLVTAVGTKIEVWSLPTRPNATASANPKSIAAIEADIQCEGFLLADLDRDFQFRKDALPASALPSTAAPDAPANPNSMRIDTDFDLVAYGKEGLRLFRNDLNKEQGSRSLVLVPNSEEMASLRNIRTVACIDFDHDSDLDLIVSSSAGISLWSNRGDWTFADFTPYSSLPDAAIKVDSILALDLDRDVLNDFLLGTEDADHPILLTNNLHGRYQIRDMDSNKKLAGACRATEVIDANADACWDVLSCGKQGTRLTMMKSIGRKSWLPDVTLALSQKPSVGLLVYDCDNDGFSDCVTWGPSGLELFRGGADGKLVLDASSINLEKDIVQVVACDADGDRDDDLFCLDRMGELHFVENEGGNTNQQLEIVIRADDDGSQNPRARCNMHGVGSLIELKSNGLYQAMIVRGTRTHFGIAQKTTADVVRILWTNGIPNNVLDVNNKSTVFDQQDLGGSCPYLYAWNGSQFEFCTDCLWAAPIGLQFAQGVAAPTRDWEYLKIDGKSIQPRDGRYVFQVTEELWEAAYFDAIEIMAIDHPKEIDVYTNEKVGPAELAEFRIHTVKNRILPKNVIDQTGKDVTSTVLVRDRQFTRSWKEGFNQGLAEPHWLELDMNESKERGDQLTLFMTGWVFPTCTSLNLAMSENSLKPRLSPPSIQVPDRDGKWTEVIPYAGFPGGKTKTIAIDLTGKFLSDDHRVRVVTNMELCWDEVFWTRNSASSGPNVGADESASDDSKPYRIAKLSLLKADLAYRGFSTLVAQPNNAPKRFDYQRVKSESIWPPMSGNFTRFGDVRELISEADDRMVVMGAGDALTLEFSTEAEPVPDGWVRDFIIYNVGWDKDADLNTIHGQSVEPLPFRAMKSYPYSPDEAFPTTPKYQAYLEQYQNRTHDFGSFWNQIRDSSSH